MVEIQDKVDLTSVMKNGSKQQNFKFLREFRRKRRFFYGRLSHVNKIIVVNLGNFRPQV